MNARPTAEYDDAGRLSKTTYPDAYTELRSYDEENHLASVTDRVGSVAITFS